VCRPKRSTPDIAVNCTLHLCRKVEDAALIRQGDSVLTEFAAPICVTGRQNDLGEQVKCIANTRIVARSCQSASGCFECLRGDYVHARGGTGNGVLTQAAPSERFNNLVPTSRLRKGTEARVSQGSFSNPCGIFRR